MELEAELHNIGLSSGESKIYLSLLKRGSSTVAQITKEVKIHRTNVYDYLEKLLIKGLVNYVIKGGVKHFKATHPNKLHDYIKEKENIVSTILPSLKELSNFSKDALNVEVFEGIEGIKTLLKDILREGKDHVIMGIDEIMFKEKLGHFMEWYFKEEKKIGFKERILTRDNVEFIYNYKTAIYRYLPAESFNPTPTYVYGDHVAILIWEPFSVIRIKNAALADSYKKYFEILWKQAKKKPKLIIKQKIKH
ncbi:ArsR family transcriptional regulator [Candidatus Woesearchaeota archaeon]|nr:ArsR family transcriptional regulator [Candidatus Woesearchaeota archaeon]